MRWPRPRTGPPRTPAGPKSRISFFAWRYPSLAAAPIFPKEGERRVSEVRQETPQSQRPAQPKPAFRDKRPPLRDWRKLFGTTGAVTSLDRRVFAAGMVGI